MLLSKYANPSGYLPQATLRSYSQKVCCYELAAGMLKLRAGFEWECQLARTTM